MTILSQIESLLRTSPSLLSQMNWVGWQAEQELRAEKVERYRNYADGDHDADLTPEMRAMLRIKSASDSSPFNLNHCDNIITTLTDRLTLTRIEAVAGDVKTGSKSPSTPLPRTAGDISNAPTLPDPNAAITAWVEALLERNRIDGVQLTVHDAAARDADTFVIVSFDNETGEVCFSHEEAFDGVSGMLVVYPDSVAKAPALAIKVWPLLLSSTEGSLLTASRINLYYPDRIEKYIYDGGLKQFVVEGEAWPAPWVLPGGEPIGVPIIHFPNKGVRYTQFGKGELDDAIPIQDAINRALVSMVMTAELSAFRILLAKGFRPPAGVTPGMWIDLGIVDAQGNPARTIEENALRWLQAVGVEEVPAGEIAPYIEEIRFLVEQMYMITKTPMPGATSPDASGESRKQHEIGLLGKVKRAQVAFGNRWEDTVALAHRVQRAFGVKQPPPYLRFTAQWARAEIRNDEVVIKNAGAVADKVDLKTYLQLVADTYGWDESKIDQIIAAKAAEDRQKMTGALSTLPGFGGFSSDRVGAGANQPTANPLISPN